VLPIVYGLEKEYGDRITFVRVNILDSNNEPLMKQFGFSATPELYLVDEQGRIIAFWDDAIEANELRRAFDKTIIF
jgi:thiol-disulfide isomerase/thioredoxin